MAKKLNPDDVLKYGTSIASLKAGISHKRWRKLVKYAHGQGHTVAGQLSGAPNKLMERTQSSLRKQAESTVAAAYKPVQAELSRRDTAAKLLAAKRTEDEAAYTRWETGEVDKLNAQAKAADTTLATQQSDIATDLNANQAAAKSDSMQRMAQLHGVSDPNQSTALDTTAADAKSAQHVAASRELTSQLTHIGADADQVARTALIATAAVRAATRSADSWKTQAQIDADRTTALGNQAKDTTGMFSDLRAGEVDKAQKQQEFGLAQDQLGVKADTLANQVKQANRKYGLDKAKLALDDWKAKNQDAVAHAKIKLGYDQIASSEGKAAAKNKLDEYLTKYKADQAAKLKDSKAGVTKDERTAYRSVETARGMISREHKRGTDPAKIRQKLRSQGIDDVTIDVANDLWRRNGSLSAAGRAKAKRLGILHVGYFYPG